MVKEVENTSPSTFEFSSNLKKMSFEQYLIENNIKITSSYNDVILKNITEKNILQQLQAINEFHRICMGYTVISNKIIRNKLGKAIEKYKLSLRNLKRDVKSFSLSNSINEFENILIDTSKEYIGRAEKCLYAVESSDYISLLKRSMRKYEICLGNTYFTNLKKTDCIEIGTLKRCSYNMVEIDGIYFINKMKRNGYNTDFQKLINEFCRIEGLKDNSGTFMAALVSYPHEYMKCVERYRKRKKDFTIEDFKLCLKRSIEKDGETIL